MLPARHPTTPASCTRVTSPHFFCTWSMMGGCGSNQETKSLARPCSLVVARSLTSVCESFSRCPSSFHRRHSLRSVRFSSDLQILVGPGDAFSLLCLEVGKTETHCSPYTAAHAAAFFSGTQ